MKARNYSKEKKWQKESYFQHLQWIQGIWGQKIYRYEGGKNLLVVLWKREWREKKIIPDQWDFTFSVDKRSAGNAPKGYGVAVGIVYHWYVVAHQIVKKADVNKYTTTTTGIKYKLAHKRAEQENWNITEHTQKKLLIRILEGLAIQLKGEKNEGSSKIIFNTLF